MVVQQISIFQKMCGGKLEEKSKDIQKIIKDLLVFIYNLL